MIKLEEQKAIQNPATLIETKATTEASNTARKGVQFQY
jgi:hypothetical protein